MKTILGISGWSGLWRAIVECWASQFSFVAVQYKRHYGQLIDAPMCVVLQQMIPSQMSGVMFTVEPLTANPTELVITANFGLGESVVSAMADPDTYTVSRGKNGLLEKKGVQLGAKKLCAFMKDNGDGIEYKELIGRLTERSLSDEQILHLARIGLILETEYASPRDIEWAFHEDKLFILQARPLTSVDNIDTEFEYFHESDCGLVAEFDSLSKANVGEVFGGSLSISTQVVFMSMFVKERLEAQAMGFDFGTHPYTRHELFVQHHSQSFFTTFSGFGDITKDDLMSKGFSISVSGRIVDDEIVIKSNANKRKYLCKGSRQPSLLQTVLTLWTTARAIDKSEATVDSYRSRVATCATLREMLIEALQSPHVMSTAGDAHVKAIVYGSFNNVALLAILAHTEGGWTNRVFSDFSTLVSSCNDIVSAGVPHTMQRIAHLILKEHGREFVTLNPKVALKALMSEDTQGARLFREFLKHHGHRCLHEFDLATKTWGLEPIPVVKTLQSMVSSDSGKEDDNRNHPSIDEIIGKMSIQLNWLKRLMLKFILVRVRRGIALRERGKSALVKGNHYNRLNFRIIGLL
ncbi:hypothetical protein BIW11_02261 [Tropilaelaps mercedesae]|uniref:Pyruvate phosphate dikinase AMP/ATP-binding domain-containing protein n=1 Tax=Tropilaelaps mercedesae TaxID=418985 RepID=A0A1V9X0X3_9ACAR|nr:hypothetical protein BIW11_02261 [Tropilaelaps mercedesae]